jgi:hypothetical protein
MDVACAESGSERGEDSSSQGQEERSWEHFGGLRGGGLVVKLNVQMFGRRRRAKQCTCLLSPISHLHPAVFVFLFTNKDTVDFITELEDYCMK